MCLAIPGKIIKIKGNTAIVDYGKEKREARLIEKGYKVNDYVIVQAKIIIQKVPKKEALASIKEWKRLK